MAVEVYNNKPFALHFSLEDKTSVSLSPKTFTDENVPVTLTNEQANDNYLKAFKARGYVKLVDIPDPAPTISPEPQPEQPAQSIPQEHPNVVPEEIQVKEESTNG